MFKKISAVFVSVFFFALAGVANATPWIDVSSIDVDTAPVATLGLTIITALAAMWVLRKLIKTTNKS